MTELATDLSAALHAHADRVLRALSRHRERYVRAWLAATGMDPRECVLVSWTDQKDGNMRTIVSIERREDNPRPGA